jgi:hypothetical protein
MVLKALHSVAAPYFFVLAVSFAVFAFLDAVLLAI